MSVIALKRRPPLAVLPVFVWFTVFLIIPIFIVILFSFMHKGSYGQIEYRLDTNSYYRVFEPLYVKIVFRSVLLASFTTLSCLFFSYPLAYTMARASKTVKQIGLALVIIPFWTNFVIRIYALKLVLGENGLINQFLLAFHWISAPIALTDNNIGIAIGMLYNYLPFMVLPLFVALEKLDFSLMDAAYDLGANKFQTLTKVLFPLSLPGVITGSLFVFIPAFGEFVIPDLLGGSQNMFIGTLITETFLKSRDWPFGSALSSFLVLMAMASFLFILTRSEKKSEHV